MSDALFFPGLMPTRYTAVRDFVTTDPFALRRLDEAEEVLGYPVMERYRDASIYDWEVFETGFMAITLALADWAEEHLGLRPSVCGGQSFGAFMAAVYAGALSYADSLLLLRRSVVVERRYFESLAEPLGCLFFYRLSHDTVQRLVTEFVARGQWMEISVVLDEEVHAISATLVTLAALEGRVREEGGYPIYTMNRAEHCSAVAELPRQLDREVYDAFTWSELRLPVVSDVDGARITDPDVLRRDLLDGWVHPVRWDTIITGMRAAAVERVTIVGPRSMFERITNGAFPTVVVTPKMARGSRPRPAAVAHPLPGARVPADGG